MTAAFGPHNASLQVRTYREGVAAKVGHDLVIEVGEWRAEVAGDGSAVELEADPRSLKVRDGTGGVKPLTEGDREEIQRNIDGKVLRGRPIRFRSHSVQRAGEAVTVAGELTMAGATRPLTLRLDGRMRGTVTLRQTDWGIKPYRGLMGALKVRDDVDVVVGAEDAGKM